MLDLRSAQLRYPREFATASLHFNPGFGYSGRRLWSSPFLCLVARGCRCHSQRLVSSEIREFSECKKVVANILKLINFLKIFVLCFRMSRTVRSVCLRWSCINRLLLKHLKTLLFNKIVLSLHYHLVSRPAGLLSSIKTLWKI